MTDQLVINHISTTVNPHGELVISGWQEEEACLEIISSSELPVQEEVKGYEVHNRRPHLLREEELPFPDNPQREEYLEPQDLNLVVEEDRQKEVELINMAEAPSEDVIKHDFNPACGKEDKNLSIEEKTFPSDRIPKPTEEAESLKLPTTPDAQPLNINDLLTPEGRSGRYPSFIVGDPVEKQHFVGKEEIIEEIKIKAGNNGAVIIQGGHRTGKTSLILKAAERLVDSSLVEASSFVSFADMGSKSIMEIEEELYAQHANKQHLKNPKLVIAFDEIEECDPAKLDDFAGLVKKLKEKGNIVLINVIGDIENNYAVCEELPLKIKEKLLAITGESAVLNRLLGDEEIRQIISGGESPVFTETVIRYLTQEAGGHPLLANALSEEMFLILESAEEEDLDTSEILNELQKEVFKTYGSLFVMPVKSIIAAGFNPLTREYTGPPGEKPNEEVYKNMLPRESSTFFKNWLKQFMQDLRREKSRNS